MREESFKMLLDKLIEDEGFTRRLVCKRAGVSEGTVKNWLVKGKRPRYWKQIIQVADAMELSEAVTDRLLSSADHPTLSNLRQRVKPDERFLLARWQPIVLGLRPRGVCLGQTPTLTQALTHLQHTENSRRICLLQGMAGVGKTTLSQEIAHRLIPIFTDGILCFDCSENSESRITAILIELAYAYQIPIPSRAPLATLSLRVRSALAGKRLLFVLDNVQTREQIDWLLPDGMQCAALLTTWIRGIRLPLGTKIVKVEPFDMEDTLALFRQHLGNKRVEQELDAFKQIAALIGQLPLAATIVSHRLAMNEGWRAADFLAEELRPEHERLSALEYDDLSVRVSFNLSYQRLTKLRQHQFSQLGVFDGEPFTLGAAAHVLNVTQLEAKKVLRQLHDAALLQKVADDRYYLHQLLSQYAHDFLSGKEAYQRKITYYLTFAQTNQHNHAVLAQELNNTRMALEGALQWKLNKLFVDGVLATYLFLSDHGLHVQVESYLQAALAIIERSDSPTRQTERGRLLTVLGHLAVRVKQFDSADSYLKQADPLIDARTRVLFGRIQGERHRHNQQHLALTYWQDALTLAQAQQADEEISTLTFNLAGQYARTKQFALAEDALEMCIAQAEKTGNSRLHALTFTLKGWMLERQGEYRPADSAYQTAHSLAQLVNNPRDLLSLSINRGYLAWLQGYPARAYKLYMSALDKGFPHQFVTLHSNIAEVLTWQGEFKKARHHLEQGFAQIIEQADLNGRALLLHDLGMLAWREKGDRTKARACFEESLTLAQSVNDADRLLQAQMTLGNFYLWVGEVDSAETAFNHAFILAQASQGKAEQILASYGQARVAFAQGNPTALAAAKQCSQALTQMGHYRAKSVNVWLKSKLSS